MSAHHYTGQSLRKLGSRLLRYLAWRGHEIKSYPAYLANVIFATKYYDLVLARKRRTFDGASPVQRRIAVLLIFPRKGVQPSHLRMMDYFRDKQYAPLIVTNLPLTEDDRFLVLERCWKLIERPNFGYDFGGYRDGVLSLGESIRDLDRLVLMNDSCWFPLPGAADWIDQADALGVDFVGAVSNDCIGPFSDDQMTGWRYDTSLPNFHYCSFALSISSAILRDIRVLEYWRRLSLTNEKFEVVRRGEVALSQLILKLGYSHGATLDIVRLDQELHAYTSERIRDLVGALVIPEDQKLRSAKHRLLERFDASESWRRDALQFLLGTVARTGAAYALPDHMVRKHGFPFLKKSPVWLDHDGADATIRFLSSLNEDGAKLLAEANALRKPRGSKPAATQLRT